MNAVVEAFSISIDPSAFFFFILEQHPLNCTEFFLLRVCTLFHPFFSAFFFTRKEKSKKKRREREKKANDCHKAKWNGEKFAVGILSSFFTLTPGEYGSTRMVKIIIMSRTLFVMILQSSLSHFFIEMISHFSLSLTFYTLRINRRGIASHVSI